MPLKAVLGHLTSLLVGVTSVFAASPPFPPPQPKAPLPNYHVQGHVDWQSKTLLVHMQIVLGAQDARAQGGSWLLHVPSNRFLTPDSRGTRRTIQPLPLLDAFELTPQADSETPAGFSPGGLVLHEAKNTQGHPLQATWLDNASIPVGYSSQKGLLELRLPNPPQPKGIAMGKTQHTSLKLRRVFLTFTLKIPRRIWEGWHEDMLVLRWWLPELANWDNGEWVRDVHAPRIAHWQMALGIQGPKAGYALLGHGETQPLQAGSILRMLAPSIANPSAAKTLRNPTTPRVKLRPPQSMRQPALVLTAPLQQHTTQVLNTTLRILYPKHAADQAQHILRIAAQFVAEVKANYAWVLPKQIVLAPTNAIQGDMRAMGQGLVLIPQVWWKNPVHSRRLLSAEVVKTMAKLWLGEHFFFHETRAAWLRHGLSGWLAIHWIETRYGPHVGLRQGRDWLNPNYREHYYERRVRQAIREQRDVALNIDLQNYPDAFAARVAVFHKAPLVVRMLQHVLGMPRFARLLQSMQTSSTNRIITPQQFQKKAEAIYQQSLAWFFKDWVEGVTSVDLAIERVTKRKQAGKIALRATLTTTQALLVPIGVVAEEENGRQHRIEWLPHQPSYILKLVLTSPLKSLSIDPKEAWFEEERKNNEYPGQRRFRPMVDLVSNRDLLITFRAIPTATLKGGNVLSWGGVAHFNESHNLSVLLNQSQKKGCCGFVIDWEIAHIGSPRLTLNLKIQEIDEVQSGEVALLYRYPKQENIQGFHRVGAMITYPQTRVDQEIIWSLIHYTRFLTYAKRAYTEIDWETTTTNTQYQGKQNYLRHDARLRQGLWLFGFWNPEVAFRRATTKGYANQGFDIGGGEGLRGYPLEPALAHQEIATASVRSNWRVWQGLKGDSLQLHAVHLGVFYEAGRGWHNAQTARSQPLRRDAGLRLELTLNAFNLRTFPVRIEWAKPIEDTQYQSEQLILFGAWLF